MSKGLIQILIFLLIIGLVGSFGWNVYSKLTDIPSDSPKGDYSFTVENGDTLDKVATDLEESKVIGNKSTFLVQAKSASNFQLQPGGYTLKLPAKVESIIDQIDSQSRVLASKGNRETVKITFKEGENMDQMLAKLVAGKVASLEELTKYAQNPKNFSTDTFPFLPKPLSCTYGDLKNCAKYYPEGYLYPDTYEFFKPSTVAEIYNKLLANFRSKVWTKVKDEVQDKDFYKVITLASVLEKETGRTKGITDKNRDELSKERKIMAGVFYNRVDKKMQWQSDVTAEYGTGRKLCQQTFEIKDCMRLDSEAAKTQYNTYIIPSYPIGPIVSPQLDNIQAALDPEKSDYLFFVSDVTGKKYFAKSGAEHEQIIKNVNKINRELGL